MIVIGIKLCVNAQGQQLTFKDLTRTAMRTWKTILLLMRISKRTVTLVL